MNMKIDLPYFAYGDRSKISLSPTHCSQSAKVILFILHRLMR